MAGDSLEGVEAIDVNVPLKGGKVHGSLARAGKVKGQTPKVDPQEKKKKKTGRAKRRIQYNRRFVNVVQTFGRKRGPNANSYGKGRERVAEISLFELSCSKKVCHIF